MEHCDEGRLTKRIGPYFIGDALRFHCYALYTDRGDQEAGVLIITGSSQPAFSLLRTASS